VHFVTRDRRTESLALYYNTLTEAQRTALQGGNGHVAGVVGAPLLEQNDEWAFQRAR